MADTNYINQIFKALPTPSLVLRTDAPKFTIIEVNDAYLNIVKCTRESILGKGFFEAFANYLYYETPGENLLKKLVEDHKPNQTPVCKYEFHNNGTGNYEARLLISSNMPVFNEYDEVEYIIRSLTDVTSIKVPAPEHTPDLNFLRNILLDSVEAKRFENLERLERNILQLSSRKYNPLSDVLKEYLLGIEQIFPQMKCSVMRIKDNILQNLSSPSLHPDYIRAINNLPIRNDTASCGSAAYYKKRIVVSDIATDPLWADYKETALKFGLLACWSSPIIDSDDNVIGTFAVYYDRIKTPDEDEIKGIERAITILNVILENRQSSEIILASKTKLKSLVKALTKSNEKYELISRATNDAIYDWDITSNHIEWGQGYYKMFGFEMNDGKFPLEYWSMHIHPADRRKIKEGLENTLDDKCQSNWIGDYRFRKANGSYACIQANGYILRKPNGNAYRMIGILRDVTERLSYIEAIEEKNKKFQEIAWMQSHVIRAPLARLIALVDLIRNYENTETERNELMDYLLESAYSLDDIIRNISDKTVSG
ncbi:PAS domain-containing protein [Dyadobacter flavalbus]|nr:PAS domain-containing protein [Dyadobacter flavalbus]